MFYGYDEEEKEINIPTNRKFKPKKVVVSLLGLSLITGVTGVPNITENNPYVVEAKSKKDKKKPVIKFSGKSTITVEKNKSVKIQRQQQKIIKMEM